MLDFISEQYGLDKENLSVIPLGNGLINSTWKLTVPGSDMVLQKINTYVFEDPRIIDNNLNVLSSFLEERNIAFNLVAPLKAKNGSTIVKRNGSEYYRLFPYVNGSHSIDVVETPAQAFEAASMFGRFTNKLAGVDTSKLQSAIPQFHDLSLRYNQFLTALENAAPEKVNLATDIIDALREQENIVEEYRAICLNKNFRLRVTHHDTKISNVLFDKTDKGICVIDLDTVMPGYFFSDVGDMMRTYLSPVGEEENDFSKIEIREDFYRAIVSGYTREMKDELTTEEQGHFFYAGNFMIYMQALRFLTDFLNNDAYYGAKYPGHNLVRAANQAVLLQKLQEKRSQLIGTPAEKALFLQ